jgi:hypothetical protein
MRKYFLLLLIGVTYPSLSFAYVATSFDFLDPYVPFEISPMPEVEQFYLAELNDYPHLYQFVITTPATYKIALRALPQTDLPAMRPALILVRDIDPNGVEEVTRLTYDSVSWQANYDPRSRLSYQSHESLFIPLDVGIYRLEVSSPGNVGKYMLVLGEDLTTPSIGTTFKTVRSLYDFYDMSVFGMLRTPVVFYPLGILFLLTLLLGTWQWQRRSKIRS